VPLFYFKGLKKVKEKLKEGGQNLPYFILDSTEQALK